MFTEIFIVEVPNDFDNPGGTSQRAKHRASVIENSPHFFIELFVWFIQANRERHIRLARAVLAHVLCLFVKAGVDRVVLVPGDHSSRLIIDRRSTKRVTHDVPKQLDPPPADWEPVFDALAKECNLAMQLPEGFELVREFTKTLEM